MKNIISIILTSLVLSACSDQYSEELELKPTLGYIYVTPSSLNFNAIPTKSQSISVISRNAPWYIENDIDWISPSVSSGDGNELTDVNLIDISASPNPKGDESRIGVFYVNSDISPSYFEKAISVSQSGALAFIKLSQTTVSMSGAASTAVVNITSNCSYNVVYDKVDWLSIEEGDSCIEFIATANETDQYREATIQLSHNGQQSVTEKIAVTQAPASISASTDTLVFNNLAGEQTIKLTADAKWKAATQYSWIEINPANGNSGVETATISVSPNSSADERIGYVVLYIGDNQKIQIPVRQQGVYINSDKNAIEFEDNESTESINVQSNTSWQISSLPTWISVDRTSGNGNMEIKVTAEENPYTTERNGIFTIYQQGLSCSTEVKVTQRGKTFDINTKMLTFSSKAGAQSVTISTNGTWHSYTNSDWISLSPISANGSSSLNISVSENESETERNGIAIITMSNASDTIFVVQNGKYFTIDNNYVDFTSKGGTLSVSLTSDAKWTGKIEEGANWLTISPPSGSDNANIRIEASDNASVNDRSAKVIFNTLGRDVSILIKQKARYLTVDNKELTFYAKGGTSNPITVSTDGEYSIFCSESWLNVTQSGNTFKVTSTENATSEARVGHITISLTDLKEGSYSISMAVVQLCQGGSFIRKGYDESKDYDNNTESSVGNFSLTKFGNSIDYDTNSNGSIESRSKKHNSESNWGASALIRN